MLGFRVSSGVECGISNNIFGSAKKIGSIINGQNRQEVDNYHAMFETLILQHIITKINGPTLNRTS